MLRTLVADQINDSGGRRVGDVFRSVTLAAAVAFCLVSTAFGRQARQPYPAFSRPHPAIARVAAPERDGMAFGSGTLVEVNDLFGVVVTNWHVVRDATGPIGVFFPDGFRSAATVLRVDRDWDLAALVIWRPNNVQPIAISSEPPQPGELLTIAGYGSGSFRAVSGQCTQYVSPGGNHPYEMVELAAPAREGDSGGPILNARGELAGVLFGSAFGNTTGSHCGRLREFLGGAEVAFRQLTAREMIARRQSRDEAPLASIADESEKQETPLASLPAAQANAPSSPVPSPGRVATSVVAAQPPVASSSPPDVLPATQGISAPIKTLLAAIGLIAVAYHALRLLGWAIG